MPVSLKNPLPHSFPYKVLCLQLRKDTPLWLCKLCHIVQHIIAIPLNLVVTAVFCSVCGWFIHWNSAPTYRLLKGYLCAKPFSQPRDAAQRQGELRSGHEKFTSGDGKRGLLGAPTIDFMRLRNESTLRWSWWRSPQRLSIDPNGSWRVGLSNTKHVRRNVQSCIRTCSPALWRWCGGPPLQELPRSDSVVWPLIHV